jgi:hypothetical protein
MHNLWRYMTYSIYSGIRDHMHTQVFLSSLISFLSGPLMSIFLSTHSEKILSCVLRESSRNSSSSSNRFWVLIQAHLGTFYFVFSFFPFFFFFYLCSNPDFYKIPSFELKKKIKSRSSRNVQVACVLLSPNMWTSIPSFAPASPYSNAHSMYAKWSGLPACEEETTYRAD